MPTKLAVHGSDPQSDDQDVLDAIVANRLSADRHRQTAENAAGTAADYEVVDPLDGSPTSSGVPGAAKSAQEAKEARDEAVEAAASTANIAEQYGTPADATTFQSQAFSGSGNTFTGWGVPIGDGHGPFDAVRLRLWPTNSGDLPTQIRVLITETDKSGTVLADSGVVAVSGLTAQATNWVDVPLDVQVSSAAKLYVIYKADAPIALAQSSDSLPRPTYGNSGYYADGNPAVTTGHSSTGTQYAGYVQLTEYTGYQLVEAVLDRTAAQLAVGTLRDSEDTYRGEALTLGRAAIARLQAASPAGVACIYGLGDSWYAGSGYIPQLVDIMEAEGMTDVGPGAIYFDRTANGASANSPSPTGWTVTVAAGWLSLDAVQGDTVWGCHASTLESSATGETVTINPGSETWRTCRIDYLARSGGGTFRYRVNAGAWQTVNADNAGTQSHESVSVDNGSDLAYTVEIEALAAGVRILGVDLRKTGPGFVIHRGGNGGSAAEDFAALDGTIFADHLNAFGPHLVLVCLGTNDQASRTAAQFNDDLETTLALVAACTAPTEEGGYTVAPPALYVSPAENISTRSTLIAEYVTELRSRINAGTWAAEAAFLDFHLHAAARSANRAAGIFAGGDLYHMQTGGRVLAARRLWSVLMP